MSPTTKSKSPAKNSIYGPGEIISSSPLFTATIVAPVFCQNLVSPDVFPMYLQFSSIVNWTGTSGFIISSLFE